MINKKKPMIGILDFDIGNITSVSNAIENLNLKTIISDNITLLKSCDGYVLPGVGSAKQLMGAFYKKKV